MGHYTTLARFANAAARSPSHMRRPRPGATEKETPRTPAAFVCPACGDGADLRAACPRCEVMLRPATGVAEFHVARTLAERRPTHSRALSWGVGIGLVFPAIALIAIGGNARFEPLHFPNPLSVAGFALIAMALVVWGGFVAHVHAQGWWRAAARRWRRRAARRRRDALATHLPTDLPDVTASAVRVAGTVRVTDGEVRVESTDAPEARVRVPVDARVCLFGQDDGYLVDGQEVQVVGFGARSGGGAGAYRSANGEFVFDAARPLEVWIAS